MSPRSSIAHYKLGAKLGEGGMGAVYRATDTRLNREVAIKVLPEAFAQDAARMQRFEREAQVLASLNHPNIATIYGIEQGAIVMELVEGADLRGPVALDTALDYARQIAAGLEAAHEKGIVHRDLKPANIKVTADGVVKLLDFGLAKASEKSPAEASVTLSLSMTQAGMILGTAAYMSPEQARGKPVDRRADIWAFGVILYELLTGTTLFGGGGTVSDSLAAVITKEPDFSAVPERVRPLLKACLEKDPRQRLRDIGDWQRLLADFAAAPAPAVPPRPARPWVWIAATVLALALAAAGWWRAARPVEQPLLHLSVDLGADAVEALHGSFAISRDGARMVYLHKAGDEPPSLAVRELNQPTGRVLAGTVGAAVPFFSPDGQWIGFFADGKLKKIPVAGGGPIPLCEAPNGRGADWGDDGRIVYVPERSSGIFLVSENGGASQPLTTLDAGEASHRWPQWAPGGAAVIFSLNSTPTDWDNGSIAVYSLKTRQRKTLVEGGYFGRFLPGGYLAYERGGKLFGLRFNLDRMETSGAPVVLVEDVAGNRSAGGGQLDFSRNGLLAYVAGKPHASAYGFGWMAAGGQVEPVKGAPARAWWFPHLSPDGKRLAVSDPAGSLSVWDFERQIMTPLATPGLRPMALAWTPDGRHLLYGDSFEAFGIWWRRADGSGEPVKLLESNEAVLPSSMTPDGAYLAYSKGSPDRSSVWLLPIHADDPDHPKAGAPLAFLEQPASAQSPDISPDGRWVAFASAETGTFEVFVRPLRGGGKWRVSEVGGSRPRWSRAGRQLFYTAADERVMVADYAVQGDAFSVGKPRRWSDTPIGSGGGPTNFDVAPDGKRIVAFPADDELTRGNLHVTFLVNFFDEVKRRLP